jgi:hypothetical protein
MYITTTFHKTYVLPTNAFVYYCQRGGNLEVVHTNYKKHITWKSHYGPGKLGARCNLGCSFMFSEYQIGISCWDTSDAFMVISWTLNCETTG